MKSGVILLNKPPGITSFKALGLLKKALGHKKVGHTGTLDQFAQGLMVVLAGKMTRLASYVEALEKSYEAVFETGSETVTLDPEGEVIETAPPVPEADWQRTRIQFLGEILQSPPAYSAIHIDGKRAYERALSGEKLDIPPRKVTIKSLDILDYRESRLRVSVLCSKGTYIRSLARDWARAAGTRAFVRELKRTSVGPIVVEKAVEPNNFNLERDFISPWDFFHLWGLGCVEIHSEYTQAASGGRTILPQWFLCPPVTPGLYGLFSPQKELMAFAELTDRGWKYIFAGS